MLKKLGDGLMALFGYPHAQENDAERAMRAEQVDFGVMGGTVKAPDVETVFEAQDRLHAVYPKGHPIARMKTVTPVALAEFPLILMQRDTSVRAIVDAGFHSVGIMPKATCEAIHAIAPLSAWCAPAWG